MALLLDAANDVLASCEAVVDECVDPWLRDQTPLAEDALRAWSAGAEQAAMALAVNLGESLALAVARPWILPFASEDGHREWERQLQSHGRSRYRRAIHEADATSPHLMHSPLERAVRAPIKHFFTEWYPDEGGPQPEGLSRHVAVHNPTTHQYTRENAMLAVMLMTSLLYDLNDRYEAIRSDEFDLEEHEQQELWRT